jgi:hypothetical protein
MYGGEFSFRRPTKSDLSGKEFEEYGSGTRLFGSVDNWIIEHIEHCSVLRVRQHELTPVHCLEDHAK